ISMEKEEERPVEKIGLSHYEIDERNSRL
ncbi:MAG: hypothetical protein JWM44_3676, partial [Bacilli bacterium]|nr:hypothetical protein [Bacilli bacterium]